MPADAYSVFRAELWWRLLPLICGVTAAAFATVAIAQKLASRARLRMRPLGVGGTAEMEFALAFPSFLMSVFVTVQMTLMINANLVIDYAAFCAARSAAVWLPRDHGGREGPNEIVAAESSRWQDSEKWQRIHRAATFAVIPISPRLSRFRFGFDIPALNPPFNPRSLEELAAAADASLARGPGLGRMALAVFDKWPYAYYFTDVDLLDDKGRPSTTFGGTVTARVTHDFEMAVPFAGPLFGYFFGQRYFRFFGGYYVPISASYTLMLAAS